MLSVSPTVFLGERCSSAGLAVNSVLLCKAVYQEDKTYQLDVWLALYCSEFHWSLHLAFLTFPVPMVSFHYHPLLFYGNFWTSLLLARCFSLVRKVYADQSVSASPATVWSWSVSKSWTSWIWWNKLVLLNY